LELATKFTSSHTILLGRLQFLVKCCVAAKLPRGRLEELDCTIEFAELGGPLGTGPTSGALVEATQLSGVGSAISQLVRKRHCLIRVACIERSLDFLRAPVGQLAADLNQFCTRGTRQLSLTQVVPRRL
jgi:hypothetical protein